MPSFNPAKDIPSLEGKHILVTGATSGLGRQSVLDLAIHNPSRVYLCGRTVAKAQQTINEINLLLPANSTVNISPLALDLSSFASVRAAAAVVLQSSERLDILMLNAGIMAVSEGLSKDGYEIQLATNHLSHALLTHLLLPLLQRTSAKFPGSMPRVVCLSSRGHASAPGLEFDSFKTTATHLGPYGRYFQSKLSNVLWVRYMARKFPEILFVAIHPGLVQTSLMDNSDGTPILTRFLTNMAYRFLPTVQTGAKNQLWGATADGVATGEYYEPVGLWGKVCEPGKDDELALKLGEWTDAQF
ncbi:short-chain dehydrogenase/reductase [Sarocladium strictum]